MVNTTSLKASQSTSNQSAIYAPVVTTVSQAPETPAKRELPSIEVTIRAARQDDAEALAEIVNGSAFAIGNMRGPFLSTATFAQLLGQLGPSDRLLIASFEARTAGLLLFQRQSGRSNHVATIGMGVDDASTGRGIGTALLGAAISMAEDWFGISRIELQVDCENERAIGLYKRHGFIIEGVQRQRVFRDGRLIDCLMMGRLGPSKAS